MQLRFDFKTYTGSIANITQNDLDSLVVTINGASSSPVLDAGTSLLTISIPKVWEYATVTITAALSGYNTFNGSFRVFGYDLLIPIYLVQEGLNYAGFTAYREPIRDTIWVYNTSSYINDTIKNNNTPNYTVDEPSATTIVYTSNQYEWVSDGCGGFTLGNLIDTKTEVLNIARNKNHYSDLTITYSCTNCEECTNIEADTVVHYSLVYDDLAYYTVDGVTNYFITTETIDATVSTVAGAVATNNLTITLPTYPAAVVPINRSWTFRTTTVGDYTLAARIRTYSLGNLVQTCNKSITIPSCNWHQFQINDCNSFTVYNWSNIPATVVINQMTDAGSFVLYSTTEIEAISIQDFDLTDGVWEIVVARAGSISYHYPYATHCKLEECLKAVINGLLCEDLCNACIDNKLNITSIITMTSFFYLTKVNRYNKLSDYLLGVDLTTLQDLHELYKTQKRLEKYCYECDNLKIEDCNCG